MRVVQIGTDKLPCPPKFGGAIETYLYSISKELARNGLEVHLITLGDKEGTYVKDNVIFHTFALNPLPAKTSSSIFCLFSSANKHVFYLSFKILRLLRRIEKEYGPINVIHTHYFTTCIAPILYKRIYHKNAKLILHLHNEPKSNRINKWIAREYELLLSVSNFVKQSAAKNLGVNEKKVKVIYNGIDTTFFSFNEKWRRNMREKLGIKDDALVLLFVGRIVPEKGLHLLIQALPKLVEYGIRFKLLVVGPKGHFDSEEGDYFRKVEKLSKDLNLSNNILFFGTLKKEEVIKIYSSSDIVVVPSIWDDPCPSVVLEAMACQRPVVAFSVGGIPELLDNQVGYLLRLKSADEICYAIMKLNNRNILSFMGNLGRQKVEECFSMRPIGKTLAKIYTAA